MATSADGHTGEEVKIPVTSMHDSEPQSDDECGSGDSFGSDYATDEEALTTSADIEPNPLPPAYPDEKYRQSTPIPANMNRESPLDLLQYLTPASRSTVPASNAMLSASSMCIVCKVSPAYSKGRVSYPTCGLTCASKLASQNDIGYSMQQDSVRQIEMCTVCHVRPKSKRAGNIYPTCGFTCDAALTNSLSSDGNVPTSDPALAALLQRLALYSPATPQQQSRVYRRDSHEQHSLHGHSQSFRGITRTHTAPSDRRRPSHVHRCVVCRVKPCHDGRYVTCGIKCAETLCKQGSSNPNVCDYCHRRPKIPGHNQCGNTCRDNASKACLLCRCRPKFGRYPLCGRTCKKIATKWTPLILEARPGHTIYAEVENRFKRAWNGSGCPPIKKIYKIIENKSFLLPYDRYKKRVGNEVFRYHGTSRACTLGSAGNTRLCSSTTCALCSILRTSFKVSLANQFGAFGAGIYSSSAANKAYSYSRGGFMLLTKVVLGNVYNVTAWIPWRVGSCPSGHDSVVYDQNGGSNETIVYTDDAIRPVFLIIF